MLSRRFTNSSMMALKRRRHHWMPTLGAGGNKPQRNRGSARHRYYSTNSDGGDNDKGNRWFYAGAVLMGLVVVEQAWISYQDNQEKALFEATLAQMQEEANRHASTDNTDNSIKWDATMPALFDCQVVERHPSLDGVKMLRGVKVGDRVQVLSTGVGPDQAYHLCRLATKASSADDNNPPEKEASIGWYPKRFLKEID